MKVISDLIGAYTDNENHQLQNNNANSVANKKRCTRHITPVQEDTLDKIGNPFRIFYYPIKLFL